MIENNKFNYKKKIKRQNQPSKTNMTQYKKC